MHQITNKAYFLFFLISLGAMVQNKVNAQERQNLKGEIVVDSLKNLSGIHVVNLTAELGTTSNEKGDFDILAKPGDTLFFSSIQFQHKRVVVRESYMEKIVKVKLIEKFNELDEVQLDDIRLSGVLSKDLDKVPKSIYEKLGMSFPKPRRTSLQLAVQSANGGGPLLTVINTLNGKIKQLEKAEENNKRSIMVNKGLELVGKSFFTNQLQIDEKEIINFLFFCVDEPEYISLVQKESIMKLLEFFEDKIVSFKELRELD